jgi:predicted transcriptional regulator
MRSVTLGVAGREESDDRFSSALDGREQGAFITFESPALLFKVLSAQRWVLLREMIGSGGFSIATLSKRLGREGESVGRDVDALLDVGILRRLPDGRVEFPFDALHVDFMLAAA